MAPFARYAADPQTVRAAADDATASAQTLDTLSPSLARPVSVASSNVCGVLAPPLQESGAVLDARTRDLGAAALVAQGSLNRWARAIDTFNSGVDDLNRRYAEAAARDFGVPAATVADDATPQERSDAEDRRAERVGSARTALLAQLEREYATLETTRDDEGDAVAALLTAGPTDATVQSLVLSADIPQGLSEIWDSIVEKATGKWTIPGDPVGAGGWGWGQFSSAAGATTKWMTTVHLGRYAPRMPNGQFAPYATTRWGTFKQVLGSQNKVWVAKPGAASARAGWATAGKVVSRAGVVVSAGIGAWSQWQADEGTQMDTSERVTRAAYRGAGTAAAGWAGAWAGAQVGGAIGTALGGPVGTVIGGVVGGAIGGIIATGVADKVMDWTVDAVGDAGKAVADWTADAAKNVSDWAGDVGDVLTFWD